MPAKWNPPNLDDLIRRYLAGESCLQLGKEMGIDPKAVKAALNGAGVETRGIRESVRNRCAWSPPDLESFVAEYKSGIPVSQLAEKHGIAVVAIHRVLREAGVTIRGRSEANTLRMASLGEAGRQELTAAAHDAARGRKKPFDELCRLAQSRQSSPFTNSPYEQIMAQWLDEREIAFIPQEAVGPYNLDFGIHPVAVEINGGIPGHDGRRAKRAPERLRYILDSGRNVLIIWAGDRRRYPFTVATADYLIAFVEESRRDPALRGQYRVIWGDGRLAATPGFDLDKFPFKPSRRSRFDACG